MKKKCPEGISQINSTETSAVSRGEHDFIRKL